ncbi:hypothetical protein B0813_001027 [Candidatus Fervidibacteria bacterium JGI MDM2 SSWTFF-3-K9]
MKRMDAVTKMFVGDLRLTDFSALIFHKAGERDGVGDF